LLNLNVTNDGADRKEILKELSKVYGDDAESLTPRFNTKGGAFIDSTV
jgi:hypothetical protein